MHLAKLYDAIRIGWCMMEWRGVAKLSTSFRMATVAYHNV